MHLKHNNNLHNDSWVELRTLSACYSLTLIQGALWTERERAKQSDCLCFSLFCFFFLLDSPVTGWLRQLHPKQQGWWPVTILSASESQLSSSSSSVISLWKQTADSSTQRHRVHKGLFTSCTSPRVLYVDFCLHAIEHSWGVGITGKTFFCPTKKKSRHIWCIQTWCKQSCRRW